MSFSNHYDSDLADRNLIRHAVNSPPLNINGLPPIPLKDLQESFTILYKAAVTHTSAHSFTLFHGTHLPLLVKQWKTANENVPPFADTVISPLTGQYLSVNQAIPKINDGVPWEYCLVKPHTTVYTSKGPRKMNKEEYKLFQNGDTDGLMKRWGYHELQVLEDIRRQKLFESINVAIGLIETAMITLPFTVYTPYLEKNSRN
ncbi:hypothetical protein EDD18DRAFT_1116729 [Armillaria luteobubalina]|uniref:Uncharacterized protein n=1 Tax=Armillaria luteobubalina TaxID=153913 RepID=A0AA39U9K4_9AGAR|nr:hypothetical protein EDD18DRAFT_1116729 [Armillaria luteobubalina]